MRFTRSTIADVGGTRLRREPWREGSKGRRVERGPGIDRAGQESGAKRTPWHEADAELFADREHTVLLHIARPQGVLALDGSDGQDLVRTANGLGRRLGQAEVLHLAGRDEVLHRAGNVLDRYRAVAPAAPLENSQ
jgi:hypothetical protein